MTMTYIASIAEQFSSLLGDYPLMDISFLGNKIRDYIVFLIFFVLLFIILKIFKIIILKRVKRVIKKIDKKIKIGNLLIPLIDSVKTPFYWFLSFYLSAHILNLTPLFSKIITTILIVWVAYQTVKATQVLIDYGLNKYLKKEKDEENQYTVSIVSKFVKALLWIFATLIVLSNFGVNITSIVAGLGIGGIAIAFALQNILSDLFSSFAIYFDKPFIVGDFIITGDHMGVVEKIGIKSTRIRALQGEEIVISNKELTSSRIQNFKKMKKRRIVFNLGVVYETPLEKLKKIPSIIKKIVDEQELTELDRVHFKEFGDFSLNFEIVYYVLSGDYTEYMDAQQNMFFKIKKAFEQEKITIAFPTQTIYIEKDK